MSASVGLVPWMRLQAAEVTSPAFAIRVSDPRERDLGDDTPPSRGSAVPKTGSKEKTDKKPDTGGMEPQPQG